MTLDHVSDSAGDQSPTTAEYLRVLRTAAGLTVKEVARRAGVTPEWLERVEDGALPDGPSYELLLKLVAATQPPRPAWWDSGHEHDLNLPPSAVRDRNQHPEYWQKIEKVREANRRSRAS